MQVNRLIFCFLSSLFFISSSMAANFALSSTSFVDSGALPDLYTCDSKNISPGLQWANSSPKTQSYALIFTDIDAPSGPFYHWILYNIPPMVHELREGVKQLPPGTLVGKNTWNKTEYNGPCPPKESSHTYVFTLYALDTKLPVIAGMDAKAVLEAIKEHILQKSEITTEFGH